MQTSYHITKFLTLCSTSFATTPMALTTLLSTSFGMNFERSFPYLMFDVFFFCNRRMFSLLNIIIVLSSSLAASLYLILDKI